MKKLQNNFTTPEQSQRLLDLGVPVKSADCYYKIICGKIDNQIEVIYNLDAFLDSCEYLKDYSPCWSVGRLIEIRDICAKYYITHVDFKGNYIENIIMSFYVIHATNGFDFSKLEE